MSLSTLPVYFSFLAVVISRWWSCRSSSFQFLHVAVSEPCRLSEFHPNRASIIASIVSKIDTARFGPGEATLFWRESYETKRKVRQKKSGNELLLFTV